MTKPDDRLHHTAIHEAGHAVAHVRLGLGHDGAHIIPNEEDGTLGGALGEGAKQVWDKDGAEPVVLSFLAGYAALVAAGVSVSVARRGADQDFEEAEEVISFWGLHGDIEVWLARSVELMRRPENLAAVALVAEHLLQRRRLPFDYVGVLVDMADGNVTEADFARFLRFQGYAP